MGIKVGILGENRANYDITLMPLEEKDEEQDKIQLSERKKYEKSIKDIVSSYKLRFVYEYMFILKIKLYI